MSLTYLFFISENVAPFLKQVLLYTGTVTASVIGLLISGTTIVLVIRRLSKKGEKTYTPSIFVLPPIFGNLVLIQLLEVSFPSSLFCLKSCR